MRLVFSVAAIILLTACSPGKESPRGFRLPDGDPAGGQQTFLDMQCHACHSIAGEILPELDIESPVMVELGGPVTRIRTYGELVTSIINPSHKLITAYPRDEVSVEGQSFMPDMNDYLTVRQLIDLVAYLQGKYKLVLPEPNPYRPYSP